MLLLLLACESPPSEPEDLTEVVPGLAPGDDREQLPQADARDEDLPDTALTFDQPHGLYFLPFQLTIATEIADGEIRYTLDGTDPVEDGLVYTAPLDVGTTTIVRAAVVRDGVALTRTRTATYLFPEHVVDQEQPDGWPREWWTDEEGGPYEADYEMDPDITEGSTWEEYAPTMFEALPVLSLVFDPDALWDEREGIYENPIETGVDWERRVSVELLDADGGFTVDAGARGHGGAVRKPSRSPKKNFRLKFRGEYGAAKLEYPLFPDSEVTRFETLVLRAGYNRSWNHFEGSGRVRADYVREAFSNELYRRMGHPAPHVRHAHVFLNGVYWGVYQVEERPDGDFMTSYVGEVVDGWDSINSGDIVSGDDVAWQELMALVETDLSDPENYAAVEARLDLDAFADYLVLQYTTGNVDWPDHNWWASRPREPGGRWVFSTWDSELTMGDLDEADLFSRSIEDDPGEIFIALYANEEFRVRFGDAVQRHLFAGGVLHADATVPLFQGLADAIVPGVVGESARWGDHWRDVRLAVDGDLYTYDEHWLKEIARLTNTYLPQRNAYAVATYQANGLYPLVAAPIAAPSGGEVTAGETLTFDGAGAEVWYTLDGADPRATGGGVAAEAVRYTGPIRLTADVVVRARAKDATGWSALLAAEYTVR